MRGVCLYAHAFSRRFVFSYIQSKIDIFVWFLHNY